ncbi:MAG: hypothetical protein CMN76_04740 [Spirochaetaceae bacterium]|nr:hypothetical protein [Spirochaetaceae bacterium]|tara:strand:- start:1592 stop:2206 length:615 start_codon:yes stop_codon:yes gene_type:complete
MFRICYFAYLPGHLTTPLIPIRSRKRRVFAASSAEFESECSTVFRHRFSSESRPRILQGFQRGCLLLLAGLLVFAPGLSATENEPATVGRVWFKALMNGDSETVASLTVPEAKERAEDMTRIFRERSGDSPPDVNRAVDGYLATMECEIGYSIAFCKPKTASHYMLLRKVHGQWLVDPRGKDSIPANGHNQSSRESAPEQVAGQ